MNDFKDSPAAYWVAVGRGVLKEDILAAVESQAQEVQGLCVHPWLEYKGSLYQFL